MTDTTTKDTAPFQKGDEVRHAIKANTRGVVVTASQDGRNVRVKWDTGETYRYRRGKLAMLIRTR